MDVGSNPFRIVPAFDGFIIAGTKNFKLWIAQVKQDGKATEISLDNAKYQLTKCFDIISTNEHLY